MRYRFVQASKSQSESENKNDELYDDRRELQKLVLEGRITDCLERLEKKFPDLLESNHNIYFELRYRQLIEILAGTGETLSFFGQYFNKKAKLVKLKNMAPLK